MYMAEIRVNERCFVLSKARRCKDQSSLPDGFKVAVIAKWQIRKNWVIWNL